MVRTSRSKSGDSAGPHLISPLPAHHAQNTHSAMALQLERTAAKKHLSKYDRELVLSAMLRRSSDGVLQRGALAAVAKELGTSRNTTSAVWRRAKEEYDRSGVYSAPSRMHLSGRKRADRSQQHEQLRSVAVEQRSTIRAAAAACGVPVTTLFRDVQGGILRVSTRVARPVLTQRNMEQRLVHCAAHVTPAMRFSDMDSFVHLDEKLFYMATTKKRVVLLPDEQPPALRLKSRRHIPKVMMLVAVARPRWVAGYGHFDGKIGAWAFLTHAPARRSSRHRAAGVVVASEQSVTKSTYRAMLLHHVLPAIRSKWPDPSPLNVIRVQHDNAPAHAVHDDPEIQCALAHATCPLSLFAQPPNSPDLNVLDLGVFNALQARQRQRVSRSLDELAASVCVALDELPTTTLDASFLTLQCVMDACIRDNGGNNFSVPHMSKARLAREGRLPRSVDCSAETIAVLCGTRDNMHVAL